MYHPRNALAVLLAVFVATPTLVESRVVKLGREQALPSYVSTGRLRGVQDSMTAAELALRAGTDNPLLKYIHALPAVKILQPGRSASKSADPLSNLQLLTPIMVVEDSDSIEVPPSRTSSSESTEEDRPALPFVEREPSGDKKPVLLMTLVADIGDEGTRWYDVKSGRSVFLAHSPGQ